MPVITDEGDVRLVRDLLGREQVITQPYYASPRLLRGGLQEYSFESGLIRKNYGISSATYGRALMVGTDRVGLSDRLTADTGALRALDATLDLQGDSGTYELEGRSQSGSTQAQASATGGFAFMARHAFPTREIDDSFAVVRVGDESGVRIYRENQLVGQTDSSGYALVPGLRAYQSNAISMEQADLPLDVVIDTMQAQAVPYYRSGVMLDFPIVHPNGALLAVRLENGDPLPAGALVRFPDRQDEFPSGAAGLDNPCNTHRARRLHRKHERTQLRHLRRLQCRQ